MKTKILMCGDRNWKNRQVIEEKLIYYKNLFNDNLILIHGAARGADSIAGETAQKLGIETIAIPADWTKYGRSAGAIRNRQMLDLKPFLVVAFHNDLATSKGTKDCVNEALKRNIQVYIEKEKS